MLPGTDYDFGCHWGDALDYGQLVQKVIRLLGVVQSPNKWY